MIFLSSMGMVGSSRERAPVARMMDLASTVSLLPSALVTSTLPGASSLPVPITVSILFFLNRKLMPLLMPSATPRLRCTTAPKS